MKMVAPFFKLGWLLISIYLYVKEGSSLCQKETKHGFTSNTSLYQVYATSVAVWTTMTRTVIFGWIAKGH